MLQAQLFKNTNEYCGAPKQLFQRRLSGPNRSPRAFFRAYRTCWSQAFGGYTTSSNRACSAASIRLHRMGFLMSEAKG